MKANKTNKEFKGSALVDYVVPAALIGVVVGMSIYFLISSGSLTNYFSATGNMKLTNDGKAILNENEAEAPIIFETKPAPISSTDADTPTPTNPVKTCQHGICDLDFGEYVLRGIPENFQEYTENSGNSGGTEVLASLIEQIADQMEAEGKIDEASLYRKLANFGHLVGDLQEKTEHYASDCYATATPLACVNAKLNDSTTGLSINPELAGDLSTFNTTDPMLKLIKGTDVGGVRNLIQTNPALAAANKTQLEPAYSMILAYDQIMGKDKYSKATKQLTSALYSELSKMAIHHRGKTGIFEGGGEHTQEFYDPITGAKATEITYSLDGFPTPQSALDRYIHPPASDFSDIKSVLICVTGQHTDTGSQCY
jgi:hypothetical protein